jgi:hypothetical protein
MESTKKTETLGIFISVAFIITAIALNIRAASWMNFATKYSIRNQAECGNEYLEIDTPTYTIYEIVAESKKILPYMTNSFIITQVALYVILTFIVVLFAFDLYGLTEKFKNDIFHKRIRQICQLAIIILLVGYLIYLSISFEVFDKIFTDMETAHISDLNSIINNKGILSKQYLPTLAFFTPILLLIWNKVDITKYAIFVLLYIVIISFSFKMNASILNLIYQSTNLFQTNVLDPVNGIQHNVEQILTDTVTNVGITVPPPPPPFTTYENQMKYDLMQNIKSHEIVDGDAFILQDYAGKYWKYIIHQNGNELNDLLIAYPNNPVLAGYITNIRNKMRNLRNDTTIQEAAQQYTQTTLNFAVLLITVILFAIFHFTYVHLKRPVTATVSMSSVVLLLLIIGPLYGWVMRIVHKTY